MTSQQEISFNSMDGLEAVFQSVNESIPIRKIGELLERTNLSADGKAIVLDIANFTIRVGDHIIALGRKIVSFAFDLIKTFPNISFGVGVALILGSLSAGIFAGIPLVGVAIAGFLKSVLLIVGITTGAIADMMSGDMGGKIDALVSGLSPLRGIEI